MPCVIATPKVAPVLLKRRLLPSFSLRGLIGFPFHYFDQPCQFLVNLPESICSKFRGIGHPFVCTGHLLMSNVRHEGAVKKSPIAAANCVSCLIVQSGV